MNFVFYPQSVIGDCTDIVKKNSFRHYQFSSLDATGLFVAISFFSFRLVISSGSGNFAREFGIPLINKGIKKGIRCKS